MKKREGESVKRFNKMEMRIEEMEKNNEKTDLQKRKRKEQENEKLHNQPAGKNTPTDQPCKTSYADRAKPTNVKSMEKEIVEEIRYKSTWARNMSQKNLEEQLIQATKDAQGMEEEGGEVRSRRTRKKKLKLGDSAELHEAGDWPWDFSEADWDGTEDKVGRNKAKKEKERMKRKEKVEKAALIGQCSIGVGPILEQSIEYFNRIIGDYGEAKRMVGAEFLQEFLKFFHRDMSDINITDTK